MAALYATSSGSLLIFTNTGDSAPLTLTVTLQFMAARTGRCTVLYHTPEREGEGGGEREGSATSASYYNNMFI